jgi:hypothetical protein
MTDLREFKDLEIDWNMTPADAVALYLEWGNTGYGGGYQNRVTSKDDYSNYFMISSWEDPPKVYLVRRNSDGAEYLAELELPEHLREGFRCEEGDCKGVYGVTEEIKSWLENQMHN